MSLTAREIGVVVAVLGKEITGGLLRKVLSSKSLDHLVLELWTTSGKEFLQFVLSPQLTRLGRIEQKLGAADFPHPFVMLLRRDAVGMAVSSVEQLGGDRAVSINFKGRNRSGSLICELTSRQSNIFWLDAGGSIVGSFHPNRSCKRQLVPGAAYELPALKPQTDNRSDEVRFEINGSVEKAIEAHYSLLEIEKHLSDQQTLVTRTLKGAKRKLDRLLKNLNADKKRADEAAVLQMSAHLLQSNLNLVKKGMTQMDVVDFEGRPATIVLDPSLDSVGNMKKMFSKAKRLRRATSQIDERLSETTSWVQRINLLFEKVPNAQVQELTEIIAEVSRRFPDLAKKSIPGKRSVEVRLPYREFLISLGRVARVGRSAVDNDTLTLKHAKPNDLWMHVRGRKGSHVVVPMGRGENPSAQILIDAAHLAVHYSDARGDTDVEVSYTLRRYVQKPRGAAKGAVRLIREKTVLVRVDKERLNKLLKGGYQSPGAFSEKAGGPLPSSGSLS